MARNIVIFGPAHSGKSTLAGYLVSQLNPTFKMRSFINGIKDNVWYKEVDKYRYIMDDTIDEREPRIFENKDKLGTSKYMHASTIKFSSSNITIIDTPGAEHKYKEREGGIYMGEIGIFIIEISKILNLKIDKSNRETLTFLNPLFLWTKVFKKELNPIIVISKVDESKYSEYEINLAISIIRRIIDDENLEIIPVAIDVKNEIGYNILTKTEELSWYNGNTLQEKLYNYIKTDIGINSLTEPILIELIKINKTNSINGIGKVYRGKVLQGSVLQDTYIKISPVKIDNKITSFVTGKIETIKFEKGELTQKAEKGHIIGINIKDLKFKDRRIQKDQIELLKTSTLIDDTISVKFGNLLCFKVDSDTSHIFSFNEQINILWYGKFITSHILYKKHDGKYIYLYLYSKSYFSIGVFNEKFIHKTFFLRYLDISNNTQQLLYSELNYVEELQTIILKNLIKFDPKNGEKLIQKKICFRNDDTTLKVNEIENIDSVLVQLKKYFLLIQPNLSMIFNHIEIDFKLDNIHEISKQPKKNEKIIN